MDVDLVYNYVNGNDKEWLIKRSKYTKNSNQYNTVCRFRDNDELLFSLRSVEKYASWIRYIYILVDSKLPEWLNTKHEKIRIVHHTEVMPQEILPCYNSNVIEAYMDRIPGLSEFFLYANDDMLFGNYVDKEYFIKNNKPIVQMKEAKIEPINYYYKALFYSQRMIFDKFGKQYDLIPSHNVDVYLKEEIKNCKNTFSEEFKKMEKNRFRADGDIQRVIFHYYMLANDLCYVKISKPSAVSTAKKLFFPKRYLDYIGKSDIHTFMKSKLAQLYFKRGPKLLCLNDSEKTTEQDLEKYNQLMKKKFPKKSSFEN